MTATMDFYKNRVLRLDHPEFASADLVAGGGIWIYRRFRQNSRTGKCYVMHACTDGNVEVNVDDDWAVLSAGNVYVTSPGARFSLRSIEGEPATIIWARFDNEIPIGQVWPMKRSFIISADTTELLRAYQDLFSESLGQRRPTLMRLRVETLDYLFRHAAAPGNKGTQLLDLWHRVDANLGRHWTLAELAREAHMSQEKLRLVCRAETDSSPMRYVTQLRVRKAAELFEEDDLSVQEVADLVGYESVFAFSRTFKKHMGVSPQAYRKSCRRS